MGASKGHLPPGKDKKSVTKFIQTSTSNYAAANSHFAKCSKYYWKSSFILSKGFVHSAGNPRLETTCSSLSPMSTRVISSVVFSWSPSRVWLHGSSVDGVCRSSGLKPFNCMLRAAATAADHRRRRPRSVQVSEDRRITMATATARKRAGLWSATSAGLHRAVINCSHTVGDGCQEAATNGVARVERQQSRASARHWRPTAATPFAWMTIIPDGTRWVEFRLQKFCDHCAENAHLRNSTAKQFNKYKSA